MFGVQASGPIERLDITLKVMFGNLLKPASQLTLLFTPISSCRPRFAPNQMAACPPYWRRDHDFR